jgi:sec-independent protein translocase protein TatC
MRGSVKHSQKATKLVDHIRELRKRFIISFTVLILSGVVVYLFYGPLLDFLRSPLGAPLFYSSPAGSFSFVMKICFMGALAITIPVIVFNLLMFIRPAFSQLIAVKRVVMTSILSAFLALAGAAFGFYYIVPGSLRFFAGFQVSGLNALISADSYLGFVTNVIITFVLVFQLPLLIAFIDKIKPLRPRTLLAGEKWVILGSLAISVLVPFAFDLVTSLLIALPIVVLYNLAIVIVTFQHAATRLKENKLYSHFDPNAVPSSSLSLETVSFEELVGEQHSGKVVKQITAFTIIEQPATKQPLPVSAIKRAGMDIRRSKTPPETVTPAEWVHRVHEPIPLNSRMRLVTDISRRVSA